MSDASEAPSARELNWSRPSTLDRTSQFRVLKEWFNEDSRHSAKWRSEAKEDFDFKAGDQWTPQERSQLKDQLRPEIVFNRSLTIIKAVAGFEINGRHETQFLPRKTQDTAVNELLTSASKWMGDECEAEDEESEAFQDAVTCGMGWTESTLDYEEDPSGLYKQPSVNPLEMYWDCRARKRNLVDSKRRARLRKMPLSEARDMFPGVADDDLDARWAVGLDPEEQTKTLEERRRREENAGDNQIERNEVHIVQMQWIERVPVWLVADEATNQRVQIPDDQYKVLKARMEALGMPPVAVKVYQRKFFQAFIGGKVLEQTEAPIDGEFSWQCITGEPDKNKGTWFGLIRVLRDPQKWGNKWLSQILHILNSQAKGGILAEPDAFDDQRQAEESYARPEAITWMKKGALAGAGTGKGPMIMPKPTAQFPAGFQYLLEFAISSMRDVVGVNLELLGQKDIMQPGVLEAQRKQAGMTVLATMFDSLRRFRKHIGKIRLFYIQNYLSDGRLIRIAGPEGAKVVPLIRDATLGQYDVVVDDAPTSPNQKQATWAAIAPLLPMFKDQLATQPELLLAVLEYGPFPDRLIELMRKLFAQAAQNPEAEKQKQLAIQATVARIAKDASAATLQNAKAGAVQATAMKDYAHAQSLMRDHGIDGATSFLDDSLKAAQITTERAKTEKELAQARRHDADADYSRVSAIIDILTPREAPMHTRRVD